MKNGTWYLDGPCSASQLCDEPGVCLVPNILNNTRPHACIDTGESERVATRVSDHERKPGWIRNAHGRCAFAILYTDDEDGGVRRRRIERKARRLASLPRGDT